MTQYFASLAEIHLKIDCLCPPRLGCSRTGDCRQKITERTLKMYGTFFLVKNPNGKFSVTNHSESVAQQMADENGSEFWEIVDPDDDGLEVTLKKATLEAGAEKVAAVEIKTLMVDGEAVKVQTSTDAEKQRIREEADADAQAQAAAEEEPEPE